MAKKIFKYPFEIQSVVKIKLPVNSNILSIQLQNGIPTLWAEVDTKQEIEEVELRIYGTGQEIPDYDNSDHEYLDYLETLQVGSFVWHICKYVDYSDDK